MKRKWTKEKCHEEALKFNTIRDYIRHSRSSYQSANKNGWIDDICQHMSNTNKRHLWTFELCQIEANKYIYKKDFEQQSPNAYQAAHRNKWFSEITKHMISLKKESGYWTYEKCKFAATECITRTDFYKKYPTAYEHSLKNNWLGDITTHMEIVGDRKRRCIYVFEFEDNSAYIGLTFNYNNRITDHQNDIRSSVFKHLKICNAIHKQLTDYINVEEARLKENEYVCLYRDNGWNILNKAKTGAVGGGIKKWTYDACLVAAQDCNSRKEFSIKNIGAYESARKNGWLDEIFKDIKQLKRPLVSWTYLECKEEAIKYTKRTTFRQCSCSAYKAAKKQGFLDDICSHMVTNRQPRKWSVDACQLEAKKYFNRSRFHTFSRCAYNAATKLGILDEICSHMIKKKS